MFAIPYLFQLVFTVIAGQIADRIRSKQILSTTATRRWQTIIGISIHSFSFSKIGFEII